MQRKLLVLNSGSSSVKYRLFDLSDERVLLSGIIERIGETRASSPEDGGEGHGFADHRQAFAEVMRRLDESGELPTRTSFLQSATVWCTEGRLSVPLSSSTIRSWRRFERLFRSRLSIIRQICWALRFAAHSGQACLRSLCSIRPFTNPCRLTPTITRCRKNFIGTIEYAGTGFTEPRSRTSRNEPPPIWGDRRSRATSSRCTWVMGRALQPLSTAVASIHRWA